MYHIQPENYVPRPTPATPDRIVAAHYYPAWKKGAEGLHRGFATSLDLGISRQSVRS